MTRRLRMSLPERLYDYLVTLGASVTVIEDRERRRLDREWLNAFCGNVKAQTGKWAYRGLRWHAFSYGYETAKRGREALTYYNSLRPKAFLVFVDERREAGFLCEGIAPPDLTELRADVYVFPRGYLWTMFFTHEQGLGPYFACTDWQALEEERSAWE
jgi:hypothetical protein